MSVVVEDCPIWVVMTAVLLRGFGSASGAPDKSKPCTVALFTVTVLVRVSVTAMVALPPTGKLLMRHWTPAKPGGPEHTPCVLEADTNVAPIGSGSETVTLGAVVGPKLVTTSV